MILNDDILPTAFELVVNKTNHLSQGGDVYFEEVEPGDPKINKMILIQALLMEILSRTDGDNKKLHKLKYRIKDQNPLNLILLNSKFNLKQKKKKLNIKKEKEEFFISLSKDIRKYQFIKSYLFILH